MTFGDTLTLMHSDPTNRVIHLMNFVDDVRRCGDLRLLGRPVKSPDSRDLALLASVAESLCDELGVEPPDWLEKIPGCRSPWFVSGLENLKAITLVESPLRFRARNIFVLENFLSRV